MRMDDETLREIVKDLAAAYAPGSDPYHYVDVVVLPVWGLRVANRVAGKLGI